MGIGIFLSFSGAYLLGMTLLELLPEAYSARDTQGVGLAILAGILLQILLEFFSKGAEHGHIHNPGETGFPWLLLSGLCLHALVEGVPLSLESDFLTAVLVHKIPVALILGGFLLRASLHPVSAWSFMVVFALMTPLGGLLGYRPELTPYLPYLLGLAIGMMLHVSTVILFESSEGHAVNRKKLLAILAGMLLAAVL